MKLFKPLLVILAVLFISGDVCFSQTIVTFAGTGAGGFSGDGGPATLAKLYTPSGVCADTSGNIFVVDQNSNCVREINTAGIISTVAGTCGGSGYAGDGGPATAALLAFPTGVAVDRSGNIYIADQFNNAIRKVSSATRIMSTIAGIGTTGFGGDGGPATNATLWHPADVAVDYRGNVFFVDQDNSRMRKINPLTGIITTMAGKDTAGFSGDGGPGTAAKLNFPEGIAVDSIGNIFIADFYNKRVRKVDTAGIITTVAGNGTGGFSGDGGPATAASIFDASAVAVDEFGQLYISDYYNTIIRKVDTAGIITTLAGNDTAGFSGDCGPATAAEINFPEGVAVDKYGNVYIADYSNRRVRQVRAMPCFTTRETVDPEALALGVFPNPNSGEFTVRLADQDLPAQIEIGNTLGDIIFRKTGCLSQNVSLPNISPGIYFLYIKGVNNCSVQKIVINKQ